MSQYKVWCRECKYLVVYALPEADAKERMDLHKEVNGCKDVVMKVWEY